MERSRYEPGEPAEPPPVWCHGCGALDDRANLSQPDGEGTAWVCGPCAAQLGLEEGRS